MPGRVAAHVKGGVAVGPIEGVAGAHGGVIVGPGEGSRSGPGTPSRWARIWFALALAYIMLVAYASSRS